MPKIEGFLKTDFCRSHMFSFIMHCVVLHLALGSPMKGFNKCLQNECVASYLYVTWSRSVCPKAALEKAKGFSVISHLVAEILKAVRQF